MSKFLVTEGNIQYIVDDEIEEVPNGAEAITDDEIESRFDAISIAEEVEVDPTKPQVIEGARLASPAQVSDYEAKITEDDTHVNICYVNNTDQDVVFQVRRKPGRDVKNTVAAGKTEESKYKKNPNQKDNVEILVNGMLISKYQEK